MYSKNLRKSSPHKPLAVLHWYYILSVLGIWSFKFVRNEVPGVINGLALWGYIFKFRKSSTLPLAGIRWYLTWNILGQGILSLYNWSPWGPKWSNPRGS